MTHTADAARIGAPLRLWPGVAAAGFVLFTRFVLPLLAPEAELFGMDAGMFGVIGGLAGGFVIGVWWMFFSRAPWSERFAAAVVTITAIVATRPFTHMSIQNGMMGMMFVLFAVPSTLSVAFVGWAVVSRQLSRGPRFVAMVLAIVAGCGVWTLARTNGIQGGVADLAWRWTPTPEERLLAGTTDDPRAPASTAPASASAPIVNPPAEAAGRDANDSAEPRIAAADTVDTAAAPATRRAAEWPGFRGPERDSVVRNVRIHTDWAASPPTEMWRRLIGPGWSSFAVSGDLLYTQEQRGEEEIVACHRVSTGALVWRHRDAVRFWESNGGAGPRATPTLSGGRVYTFGATGILNALDATTGKVVWSRNAASDTGRTVPDWGFSSSPLVVDGVVVVAAAGTLAGYDLATGRHRWSGPSHGGSYSSPHRATIAGVVQVVLLGGPGAISVAPADGTVLWQHEWAPGAIVQPALTPDGDILVNAIAATGGIGIRRLHVTHDGGAWNVEERWTSSGLKPYFNDFVVHGGHAFGFDGNILSCIDLEDGARRWKGGRYGNGQLVLLPEQNLLLVVSEDGELALVSATPDKFTELARFPALDGKTWNHPVLVGHVLLVRNGEEMVAFRLR